MVTLKWDPKWDKNSMDTRRKLEKLERLHPEDTPRRPIITHTIDQFMVDSKSKQDKI